MERESTCTTAQEMARSQMRSAKTSRRSGVRRFESSSPRMRRLGLRITAAANTGPNSAPRPASSSPAMRCQPCWRAARSKRDEQIRGKRVIGADSNTPDLTAGGGRVGKKLRLRFGANCGCRDSGFSRRSLLDTLDSSRFAFESAEVIELGAAHAASAQNLDRTDRWRLYRENALDAYAETHASHRKRR